MFKTRQVPALLLLTVALCMVPTVPSYADPPPAASPDFASIDAYIEQEMREVRIPGLALGIVHNDEVVHLRGFGAGRCRAGGHPADAVHPRLGVQVLHRAGDHAAGGGRERWISTRRGRRYLPDFRVADEAASATITVRHLLHHTSGLPEDTAFEPMLSNDMSDEALSDRVRALRTLNSPWRRQAFEYTDANYDVLGLIVQTSQRPVLRVLHRRNTSSRRWSMSHSFTNQTDARRRSGHRPPILVRLPQAVRGTVLAGRHAQQLSHLQRRRHHSLPDRQLNGGQYEGESRAFARRNRRDAPARGPAKGTGTSSTAWAGNPGRWMAYRWCAIRAPTPTSTPTWSWTTGAGGAS